MQQTYGRDSRSLLTVAINKTLMPKLVPTLHYRSVAHCDCEVVTPRERVTALSQRRHLADPLNNTIMIMMRITLGLSWSMLVPVSTQNFVQLAGPSWLRPVINCINSSRHPCATRHTIHVCSRVNGETRRVPSPLPLLLPHTQ